MCLSQIKDLDVDELVKSPEDFYADSDKTEIMDEVLNYSYWKWGKRDRVRAKRLEAYSCSWLELKPPYKTEPTYPCGSKSCEVLPQGYVGSIL